MTFFFLIGPKRVQIVVPYELNTHSLVLYVQKPRAGIYDGINVTYKEGSQRTPVSVGGDTITIENLTPGTAYDFFVYTTSVNMASAAYQVPAVKTCKYWYPVNLFNVLRQGLMLFHSDTDKNT